MIYGYARCSTNEEMQDINRQIRELKQLGATDRTIYREYDSGMKNDRVELQRLLETVKSGDTIVATEVSRITRSTKQLCEIIEFVKDKHIRLVLGSFVVDCTRELDPMTEGMLKMMGVFSELERNMISQRVKSGLQNAKAKGKQLGRPSTCSTSIIPSIKTAKSTRLNLQGFVRCLILRFSNISLLLRGESKEAGKMSP